MYYVFQQNSHVLCDFNQSPILIITFLFIFYVRLYCREEHTTYQPTVLFKRTKHHKGSIYCMAWSPQGDLVATGSNDKTVKLMRYNEVQKQLEGKEIELTMHDGKSYCAKYV